VVRVDRLSDRFWVSVPPLAVTRSDLPVVVTVELLRRRGSVPAIPAAAFRRGEGTEGSVGVVGADGAVSVRRVTAGPDLNGWIAIRRGLREGERVVVASWADDALR
jgi:multidrug efflux pump subunit AcrA (membrane-fusion protein)